MKNKLKNYLVNILIILVCACLVFFILSKEHLTKILVLIKNIDLFLFFLCIFLAIFANIISGLIICIFARKFRSDYRLSSGVGNSFVATLFHGITPSVSGGQIAQLYVFKKQGINYGQGASILMSEFIVYQCVLVAFVFLMCIFRFSYFYGMYGNFLYLVLLGFILNLITIFGLFFASVSSKFHILIIKIISFFIKKFKLNKKIEDVDQRLKKQIAFFQEGISNLSSEKKLLFKIVLLNLSRFIVLYSIPYFCARSFGLKLDLFILLDVISLSAMITMLNTFILIPGASGGIEASFVYLFSKIFTYVNTLAIMVIWRFVTFYLLLFIAFFVFVYIKNKKRIN